MEQYFVRSSKRFSFIAIQFLKEYWRVPQLWNSGDLYFAKKNCPRVGNMEVYLPLYLTREQQGHQGAFGKHQTRGWLICYAIGLLIS